MTTLESFPAICRACGGTDVRRWKTGNFNELVSERFAITDQAYGSTGTLYRCRRCGFAQCVDIPSVTPFYEDLIDPGYEATRGPRAVQAARLLELLPPDRARKRLLDVGAGSGILVEEAVRLGYAAIGIEPSRWLVDQATQRGLPVHQGILPHPEIEGKFDCVTLVDVIEHVTDPLALLLEARRHLADHGIGLIVTPDIDSLAARLLGFRWWHFRIAHVGYFNRRSLTLLMARAGLEAVHWGRPTWYFPLDYLWSRLGHYLPGWPTPPRWTTRTTVPLNLFDSFFVTFRIADAQPND
jgi:2-polyprenyl-3-methyl-5-hydroxy-6-metoxy-1,4-benzoquinol methylase